MNFLVNDDKYFKIATDVFEGKTVEDNIELFTPPGEKYDPMEHQFEDDTHMRESVYEVLGDIEYAIEANLDNNNKVIVYRGLRAKEMLQRVNERNFKWESWSMDENVAKEFSGYDGTYIKDKSDFSWFLIGKVDVKDVDWELMIDRWINFPHEEEIPVKNPMNVEINEIWNLDEDKVYKNIEVDKDNNKINYE